MKKYLVLLLTVLCIASCTTTDENVPSLFIPNVDAEVAEVEFRADADSSSFYYLLQAGQMIVNWGDNSKPMEYVFLPYPDDLSTIKPLEYKFKSGGTYTINIRTFAPLKFDFSKGLNGRFSDNAIYSLRLTTCKSLRELYCKNQPLDQINLEECTNLKVANFTGSNIQLIKINKENLLEVLHIDSTALASFDCLFVTNLKELGIGKADGNQSVSNINKLKRLRNVSIKGNIETVSFDLVSNDSIQNVSFVNTNVSDLNVVGLKQLTSISVAKSAGFKKLQLKDNTALKTLSLTNNSSLNATSLNSIFTALPQVTGTDKTIILNGNAGDADCDRSIATRKGWIFKTK